MGWDFISNSLENTGRAILEDTHDVMAIKQYKINPQELSNLSLIFKDVVSPNTLRIAHERFFPFRSLPNSVRKMEELKIFKDSQNQDHFRFSNFFPYAGLITSSMSSSFITNHFMQHFKLKRGIIPIYCFSVGLTGGLSILILQSFGYSYFARHGLPDCLSCHSIKTALYLGLATSVYPILASSILGIHFGSMSSAKGLPIDIYTSKNTFFKGLDVAREVSSRGKFLPKVGLMSSIIMVATYFAMQKEYLEFIKLFSLVCHSIENPDLSFKRKRLGETTPQ